MYNDIDWTRRGNKKIVLRMLSKLLNMLEDSRKDAGRFWGLVREEMVRKKSHHKPDGGWDKTAEGMMPNFADSGHPVFRATVPWEVGTIISVNQLSIYGAVADLCKELARDSSSAGEPAATENLGSVLIPTEFPTADTISQADADVHNRN